MSEQSLEDYYYSLRLDLSKQILDRKMVYLDTKFWLLLRDGYLHPEKNNLQNTLLNLALELSAEQICTFPISEDVFMEVMKQTDIKTLKVTAELIDKLSNGVMSVGYDERVKREIIYFLCSTLSSLQYRQIPGNVKPEIRHILYSIIGKIGNVYETKELIWTKLAGHFALNAFPIPEWSFMSSEENLIHRKSFLKHMWPLSMSQMIDVMVKNGGLKPISDFDISSKLNRDKIKYHGEANNFHQMFMIEVGGIINAFRPVLAGIMKNQYQRTTGRTVNDNEAAKSKLGELIYHLFRLDKVGKAMPAIRIISALHAAVRWDKPHKYQGHDTHDFQHAATALPYCDYFFTEKRLKHLVTQKLLQFDKLYGCDVQSNLSGAIASLEKLQQDTA